MRNNVITRKPEGLTRQSQGALGIASPPSEARNDGFLRFVAFLLLLSFSLAVSGCSEEWRKKFIRKNRRAVISQPILMLVPDRLAVLPATQRYREDFAFWKSWHLDLLDSYGKNQKHDTAYLSGMIGQLRAMQEMLTGKPSERMREILIELTGMEKRWNQTRGVWSPTTQDRTRLERLYREINRDFHYSHIKETIPPEPPTEEESPSLR